MHFSERRCVDQGLELVARGVGERGHAGSIGRGGGAGNRNVAGLIVEARRGIVDVGARGLLEPHLGLPSALEAMERRRRRRFRPRLASRRRRARRKRPSRRRSRRTGRTARRRPEARQTPSRAARRRSVGRAARRQARRRGPRTRRRAAASGQRPRDHPHAHGRRGHQAEDRRAPPGAHADQGASARTSTRASTTSGIILRDIQARQLYLAEGLRLVRGVPRARDRPRQDDEPPPRAHRADLPARKPRSSSGWTARSTRSSRSRPSRKRRAARSSSRASKHPLAADLVAGSAAETARSLIRAVSLERVAS